ncbi:efflux RND transporter periplasmic adaptor subunit [Thiorhodococcus fuscus]|uniref:Efflux RND transporter periplasmic adaptor subunit n=1 Tax=Thiorhodococcus fuscus TaxID=527200 RepID=A0ABW4YCM9_9GAMM
MSPRSRQWLVFIAALVLLAGAGLYVQTHLNGPGGRSGGSPGAGGPPSQTSSKPEPKGGPSESAPPGGAAPKGAGTPTQRPDVRVVRVTPARYQAQVSGYGEARAHYALTLTAQVSGRVDALSEHLESGQRVAKGDVLVQLEDSDYRAAVASAQNDLASAQLALLEEQRQGVQAAAEWKASGLRGKPDSELVLRKPQLAAAKAAVAHAEATLVSAREDLAETRITAPFDALVVERTVAPGSYVQAGTQVASLYSLDRLEVSVALSARDWSTLPDTQTLTRGDWPARLTSVEDGQVWTGRVLRAERHLDETTRQRALVIAVDHPLDRSPPLLPGTFVEAEVAGRELDGLWRLPSAALSQRGEIWRVDPEGNLESFAAEPVFSDAQGIYIEVPETLRGTEQQVLVHPLNGYLPGMAVNPVEVSRDED